MDAALFISTVFPNGFGIHGAERIRHTSMLAVTAFLHAYPSLFWSQHAMSNMCRAERDGEGDSVAW